MDPWPLSAPGSMPNFQQDYFTGVVKIKSAKFGFIRYDEDTSGEGMFVLPGSCNSWDNEIPPVGTPVKFTVTTDSKSGRLRAEEVLPADNVLQEGQATGTMYKIGGKFGFIMPDDDQSALFVMPQACSKITGGSGFPPLGTRLKYFVVIDETTNKPRAEDVELLENQLPPGSANAQNGGLATIELLPGQQSGTIGNIQGKFGFITQDKGGSSMFVLPNACIAFGGQIPPIGTKVVYEVVSDAKTGRPRAENVQPALAASEEESFEYFGSENSTFSTPLSLSAPVGQRRGVLAQLHAQQMQDALTQSQGMQRGSDLASKKTAFEQFQEEYEAAQALAEAGGGGSGSLSPGEESGTFELDHGKFGFIFQDSNRQRMFVLPGACEAFGRAFPPAGTRVKYVIVPDEKTGRPRAQNVQPFADGTGVSVSHPLSAPSWGSMAGPRSMAGNEMWSMAGNMGLGVNSKSGGIHFGTMLKDNGQFGFINRDDGGDNLFVMPLSCVEFGMQLPPTGTRLAYEIVIDSKTGRPRAENVSPAESAGAFDTGGYNKSPQKRGMGQNRSHPYEGNFQSKSGAGSVVQLNLAAAVAGSDVSFNATDGEGILTGVMHSSMKDGKFGFIEQDSGEERMFVMPAACIAFGMNLPPDGTRLQYRVVIDEKTGRPRAEDVAPY